MQASKQPYQPQNCPGINANPFLLFSIAISAAASVTGYIHGAASRQYMYKHKHLVITIVCSKIIIIIITIIARMTKMHGDFTAASGKQITPNQSRALDGPAQRDLLININNSSDLAVSSMRSSHEHSYSTSPASPPCEPCAVP